MRSIFNVLAVAVACTAILLGSQNSRADIVWNEANDGDLSDNPNTPTFVNFNNGLNTVIGTLLGGSSDERDYLTFTLGANQFLTGLTLDAIVADGAGFQGLNAGSTSFIPDVGTASSFLGLEFVLIEFVNLDMLPLLAAGDYGSTGFSIPLGPGTYSYVIQEITPGQNMSYQLTFNVVPEPSSAGLLCVAGLLSVIRRRRRN